MTQPRIKKLVASASALVAALAMGTAGAVTASAATLPTTNLTVTNATGRDFRALKVGDYVNPTKGSPDKVSVTTVASPAAVKTASVAALTRVLSPSGPVPAAVGLDPISYIATNWGVGSDLATGDSSQAGKPTYDGKVRQFLNELWKEGTFTALFDNSGPALTSTVDSSGNAKFANIEPGEYVVVDVSAYDSAKGSVLPMFVSTKTRDAADTADLNIDGMTDTIEAKGVVPTRPKKTTDKPDYNIGDSVKFTISTSVPTYIGYDASTYKLALNDTLSAGLSFDPTKADPTVTLKKNDSAGTTETIPAATSAAPDGYVPPSSAVADGGTITFDLSPFFKKKISDNDGKYAGWDIVVTYKAILNATAVTQKNDPDGIHNSVKVEYTNGSGVSNVGETKEGKAKVYTFDFELLKKDKGTNNVLQGAKFKVYRDGESSPLELVKTSTNDSYRPRMSTDSATAVVADLETDRDGLIKIIGVAAGKYKVVETAPATGYMQMPTNVTFVGEIKPEYTPDAVTGTVDLTSTKYDITTPDTYGLASIPDKNVGTFEVYNIKNLTQLPLTGAAGIMFLIVVGGLLVGAGVFLYMASVRSRRNESMAVRV